MKRRAPKQQKDALGRRLCRQCQHPVPRGRRSYCTKKCATEFEIAYFPSMTRRHVYRRDKGVCAKCGCDTDFIRRIILRLRRLVDWNAARALAVELGFDGVIHAGTFWQADHVKEVARGGWGMGLENFRTLCTPCHKEETARLARELAIERRRQKLDRGLFDAA